MWNSNAPLELLKPLPVGTDSESLAAIQSVIDEDKLSGSREHGRDLCGEYAPFCEGCGKSGEYTCAVAYVRMKQAEAAEPCGEQCESAPPTEEKSAGRIRIAIAKKKIHNI